MARSIRTSPAAVLFGAAAVALGAGISLWFSQPPAEPSPAVETASSASAHGAEASALPTTADETPAIGAVARPAVTSKPAARAAATDYGLSERLRRSLDRYRAAETAGERENAMLSLALSDEPGVLDFLLDELHRVEPGGRKPVLEALVQYQNRGAIPELRKMASETSSPEERKALQDTADYLALPTFTELRRGKLAPAAPR